MPKEPQPAPVPARLQFKYWMLKDATGAETGPFSLKEMRGFFSEADTVDHRIEIRCRQDSIWAPIARHPQWAHFLTAAQHEDALRRSAPSLSAPVLSLQDADDGDPVQPAAAAAPIPDKNWYTSVQDIHDLNALCIGEKLVRLKYTGKCIYRRTSSLGECIRGILFYNALYTLVCFSIMWLIYQGGFLPSGAMTAKIVLMHLLLFNPMAALFFWSGVLMITLGVAWVTLVVSR